MPYHYGKKKGKGKMKNKKKKMGRRKKQLFETCPIKKRMCGFYMEKCPLDAKKRKRK